MRKGDIKPNSRTQVKNRELKAVKEQILEKFCLSKAIYEEIFYGMGEYLMGKFIEAQTSAVAKKRLADICKDAKSGYWNCFLKQCLEHDKKVLKRNTQGCNYQAHKRQWLESKQLYENINNDFIAHTLANKKNLDKQ